MAFNKRYIELGIIIWFIHSECHYTGCSEIVYGDENSIIVRKVFCPHHYDIMNQFLNSCESYWQVVVNVGGDT